MAEIKIEVGDTVRIKPYMAQTLYGEWREGYKSGYTGQVAELFKDSDWRSSPNMVKMRVYIKNNGIRETTWLVDHLMSEVMLVKKGNGTFEIGVTCPWAEDEIFQRELREFHMKVLKARVVKYSGFENAATCFAHIYITNDMGALSACRSERRKDGTINPDKVRKIFSRYRLAVDAWALEPRIDVPQKFAHLVKRMQWDEQVNWKEVADNISEEGQ